MKRYKNIIIFVSLIAVFVIHYSIIGYKTAGLMKNISKGKSDNIDPAVRITKEQETELLSKNEDLLNVDYKKFYDDLKPYGTWIKVDLSDRSGTTNFSAGQNVITDALRSILGIKDAKADVDLGWSVFFVWKPNPYMAVGVAHNAYLPGYEPYSNGQWVYSDYGWYFRAGTPHEELTHHYGRWVYADTEGWIWIPGNVWAPAWVSWEDDDDYITWTPYTPWIYNVNRYYYTQINFEPRYIVCDRRHFMDPDVYRYTTFYRKNDFENRFKGKDHHYINSNDRYVLNKGPNPEKLERELGRNIKPVRLNMIEDKKHIRYGKNEYNVYAPFRDRKNNIVNTQNNNTDNINTYGKKELRNSGQTEMKNNNKVDISKQNTVGKRDNGTYSRRNKDGKQTDRGLPKVSYRRNGKKDNNTFNTREKKNTGIKNTERNDRKQKGNGSEMKQRNAGISDTKREERSNSFRRKYSDDTKMHPTRENYDNVNKGTNRTKNFNNTGQRMNRNRNGNK